MIRFILTLAIASSLSMALAAEGNFLNVAIVELPARYLADIPKSQRTALLSRLSEFGSDRRLDYLHGWMHWYSDGEEAPHGTSMLYVKLLPRKDGNPLVFVHMPKPFADGNTPQKNQTFVLEREGWEWHDVTASIIPKQVDLTMHFSPRRSTNVIEVAAYKRAKRQDGRGDSYSFGERTMDLLWDGKGFQTRKPSKRKLSDDA